MVSNKTLIGVTTGEYARRADFYDYLNLLEKPPDCGILLGHDRSPARGRNLIIEAALENNYSHVLLIDDDMAYKPDSLIKLLDHDFDIVSGLYLSRAYPHQPVIFDLADDDGGAFPMYLMDKTERIRRIEAAGLGFLLIATRIFLRLDRPFIRLGELNKEEWCDDIGFFKRTREAGIQAYVDMDVQIGHMGTMIIWPNFKDGKWYTGYDTNGTGAINTPQIVPELPAKMVE